MLGADFAERTWDWGALPRPFSLGRTLDGHPPVRKAFDVMLLPVRAKSLATSSAAPTLLLTSLTAAWQKGPPHGPPVGDLTSGGVPQAVMTGRAHSEGLPIVAGIHLTESWRECWTNCWPVAHLDVTPQHRICSDSLT